MRTHGLHNIEQELIRLTATHPHMALRHELTKELAAAAVRHGGASLAEWKAAALPQAETWTRRWLSPSRCRREAMLWQKFPRACAAGLIMFGAPDDTTRRKRATTADHAMRGVITKDAAKAIRKSCSAVRRKENAQRKHASRNGKGDTADEPAEDKTPKSDAAQPLRDAVRIHALAMQAVVSRLVKDRVNRMTAPEDDPNPTNGPAPPGGRHRKRSRAHGTRQCPGDFCAVAHKKEGREISTPKAAAGQCAVCTNHDKALELAEAMEKAIAEDTPPAQRLRNLLAAAHSAGNPSIADVCAILESAEATAAITLRTKGANRPFADKTKAAARFAANSAGLCIGGGTRAQSLWNSVAGLDLASPPGACSCATEPHHQPGSPWWCRKCDAPRKTAATRITGSCPACKDDPVPHKNASSAYNQWCADDSVKEARKAGDPPSWSTTSAATKATFAAKAKAENARRVSNQALQTCRACGHTACKRHGGTLCHACRLRAHIEAHGSRSRWCAAAEASGHAAGDASAMRMQRPTALKKRNVPMADPSAWPTGKRMKAGTVAITKAVPHAATGEPSPPTGPGPGAPPTPQPAATRAPFTPSPTKVTRPRGRAPKGKVWSSEQSCYVDDAPTPPTPGPPIVLPTSTTHSICNTLIWETTLCNGATTADAINIWRTRNAAIHPFCAACARPRPSLRCAADGCMGLTVVRRNPIIHYRDICSLSTAEHLGRRQTGADGNDEVVNAFSSAACRQYAPDTTYYVNTLVGNLNDSGRTHSHAEMGKRMMVRNIRRNRMPGWDKINTIITIIHYPAHWAVLELDITSAAAYYYDSWAGSDGSERATKWAAAIALALQSAKPADQLRCRMQQWANWGGPPTVV